MRRILLKVSIFALAFSLGIGVSACRQLWSLLPLEVSQTDCEVGLVERAPIGLTIVGAMDACGPTANFHTMELSDGTRLYQSCERLSSPAVAVRALQKRLVKAEIAERSEQRDEKGRRIGETILMTSPRVARLKIYGNSLCETEAPSITHLQLYEAGALHYSLKNSAND